MAGHILPTKASAKFLDYAGLGLVLTPIEVIGPDFVSQKDMPAEEWERAAIFILFGAIAIVVGTWWENMKPDNHARWAPLDAVAQSPVTWLITAGVVVFGVPLAIGRTSPTILGLAITFVVMIALMAFLRLGKDQQDILSSQILTARSLQPAHSSQYLKDVHIYAGSDQPVPLNPRFVATFIRNGQRVRLYAEDRYYPSALMGPHGWIRRPMILLGEIKDFVAGQSNDIAILTPFENDGRKMWQWGPPTEKPDPKTTFLPASHQGRLVLLVDDGAPEYFYFIIDQAAWETPPNVIGQERFDFIQK